MPTTTLPPFDALPQAAQEIARVIGIADTLKLADIANNRAVYVPRVLTDETKLVIRAGWAIAKKLHARFAGELIVVPLSPMRALSADSISAMHHAVTVEGVSIRTLAAVTRLSESGVRAAIARHTKRQKLPIPPPAIGSSSMGACGVKTAPSNP